jgi:hypothetical protein
MSGPSSGKTPGSLKVPFDSHSREPDNVARHFRHFGEVEAPKMDSRVYADYCAGVAEDPALLELACRAMSTQPPPNVLFAAVKDLLLEDATRSDEARLLARFYPAVSGEAIPDDHAFPAFRVFCLRHADELDEGLRTGRTQTCVVHRSAVMLPAIGSLPRVAADEGRVGLLEIGPSAGLNLRLDHYRYEYARKGAAPASWGDAQAKPVLACVIRGEEAPPMPGRFEVVARHGLELSPIDVGDPRAVRWLRALIWPEHVERGRLMDEALAVATRVPAEIAAGDATTDLEAAIERLPADAPRVVFATHALYQIPKAGRRALAEGIARASASQPVDFVTMESNLRGTSRIDCYAYEGGERASHRVLAESDSHGRWIAWGRED